MLTQEKVDVIEEFFYMNFFVCITELGAANPEGSNIPFQSVIFNKGNVTYAEVGDGTINLAGFLTLNWIKSKIGKWTVTSTEAILRTIYRLEEAAFNLYKDNWYVNDFGITKGFFLRDDINIPNVKSSYKMMINSADEDPCHSPFVSQDQVWNLNPILAKLTSEGNEIAKDIGININKYISNNKYTIYNPYMSKLLHFYTYCPTFNENKVKAWERQADRIANYKPKVKVKRGANNWYYSGGTKSCLKWFENASSTGDVTYNSVREVIYKGTIFILDKVYEPIFRFVSGSEFKHNSYYCYAATSGIWYNKKYRKRLSTRFNKSINNIDTSEVFEANIAPIVLGTNDAVDVSSLFNYLVKKIDEYYDVITNIQAGNDSTIVVPSPLELLTLWYWYCGLVEAKI